MTEKKTRRENRRTINFDWSRSGCNVFVAGLFISSFSLRLIQAVDEKETLYLNSVIKSNYIYDNNPCCFLQNTKSMILVLCLLGATSWLHHNSAKSIGSLYDYNNEIEIERE